MEIYILLIDRQLRSTALYGKAAAGLGGIVPAQAEPGSGYGFWQRFLYLCLNKSHYYVREFYACSSCEG